MGMDGLVAFAAAPSEAVVGADLWAAARLGIASLGLELRADAPASTDVAADGGRASVTFLAATVAPCLHASAFFACTLGSFGWLHASGVDVPVPKSGSAFVPALGPRVGIEVPLGRSISLRVRGDLLVNLLRTTVSLDSQPAWTAPLASEMVAAGLAYLFP
jgi:hypothetical protein